MPNIDYIKIFKESWRVTWANKYLWWFGFFMSLAAGFSFNSGGGNWNNSDPKEKEIWQKASDFFSQHPGLILALTIIAVIVYIIFVILATFARGGAIRSIDHLLKNQPANFRSGMAEGRKYFWPMLFLNITFFFSVILTVIVLFVPVIFLLFSKIYFGGVILAVCAVFIFIPLVILMSFIKTFGYIYITLGELRFWPAVENAYELFLKNIFTSIIMAFLFFPISILLGLGIIILLLVFLFIFGVLAAIAYFIAGMIPAVIIGGIGALLFIVSVLVIRSIYEIFSQTAWILFFREIAAQKEEEKAEEIIEELEKSPNGLPSAGDTVKTVKNEE